MDALSTKLLPVFLEYAESVKRDLAKGDNLTEISKGVLATIDTLQPGQHVEIVPQFIAALPQDVRDECQRLQLAAIDAMDDSEF